MTKFSQTIRKNYILRLKGGFGNQLFIYFYGRYLADTINVSISFDTFSGYFNNKYKHLQTTKPLLRFFFKDIVVENLFRQFEFFFARKKFNKNLIYVNEDFCGANCINFRKDKNYYLEGYFQDLKYVTPYLLEFRKIINKQKDNLPKHYNNKIFKNKSIGFHVRVNDYNIETDVKYLTSAFSYFKDKLMNNFYLFTDNIEWCEKNLPFIDSFSIVSTGDDIKDFLLLSMMENHVLTIGTYGLWASLVKERGVTIISVKSKTESPQLYPKNYICL